LITNLNVILYLSTCHTVHISVLILFMIMPQLIINTCVSLMYELKKKMGRYCRVNLLGPGPLLMKKEFSGPRSHKGWETLPYTTGTGVSFTLALKQTSHLSLAPRLSMNGAQHPLHHFVFLAGCFIKLRDNFTFNLFCSAN